MGVFNFKEFSVVDDHTPMKVGMDAVMLGAWADGSMAKRALDVGTGCGILTFMLALRFPQLQITGIDIHPGAIEDAEKNLRSFPHPGKIEFLEENFLDHRTATKYDLIISNPPFFLPTKKSGDTGRDLARFSDALPHELFLKKSATLLSEEGKMAVIIPRHRMEEFSQHAKSYGLFPAKILMVKHFPESQPKRVLMELHHQRIDNPIREELIIMDKEKRYTAEYRNLTDRFYLDF